MITSNFCIIFIGPNPKPPVFATNRIRLTTVVIFQQETNHKYRICTLVAISTQFMNTTDGINKTEFTGTIEHLYIVVNIDWSLIPFLMHRRGFNSDMERTK